MKNIKITFVLSILFVAFFSSFIGYENGQSNTLGSIQCIGNAGSDQLFTFNKWKYTEITLPDGDLEKVKASIEINTSSISCDWKDLEKGVKQKKDYFYIKKFSTATISIDGATKQEDGSYTAEALLSLKGINKKVPITFAASETAPYTIKGKGQLNRRDFGFTGNGPNDEVPILFNIVLPNE